LALIYLGAKATRQKESIGPIALRLLEKAVQDCPDDVAAWEAKGSALSLQGRMTESLAAFETALAIAPEREMTLAQAAVIAEALGRPDKSLVYLRRLVAVNPWIAEYHYKLSEMLSRRGEWQNALDLCETAMRLNPSHEPTRILLITCCLRCGKKDRAWSELQTLVGLNPKEELALRSWFARQVR
jgi:tetratricopeptide (TPR) repeat protein